MPCLAAESDNQAMVLAGWGRFPVQEGELCAPAQRKALDCALKSPYAPRGLGRSYGDASLPGLGAASLQSVYWDHLIQLDAEKGVVIAEAGVTLQTLLEVLLPQGFFLPVTPGTRHVTLGGAVASNVHGKNHHRRGSIERFVTHLVVETPMGQRRCDAELDADLFRTTLGGYGLTGFIIEVGLKLLRVRSGGIHLRKRKARDLNQLLHLFAEEDAGVEYSVAWCDTLAKGAKLGRGLLLLGEHVESPLNGPMSLSEAAKNRFALEVPVHVPSGLLQPQALMAFNSAYWWSQRDGESVVPLQHYFYPLDRLAHWNRLYGRSGFLQYQCMIPDSHGPEGLEAVLKFLVKYQLGSFLAVLKRCDDDFSGLAFCRRGYTLALDLPIRDSTLPRRLDALDEIVLRYGGRVYLSKDARLRPEIFKAMVPEWSDFMQRVKSVNPNGHCRTAMSERLQLWADA